MTEQLEAECLCVPIDVQPPALAGYDATGCETHGMRGGVVGHGRAAVALTGQGDGGFGTSRRSGTA